MDKTVVIALPARKPWSRTTTPTAVGVPAPTPVNNTTPRHGCGRRRWPLCWRHWRPWTAAAAEGRGRDDRAVQRAPSPRPCGTLLDTGHITRTPDGSLWLTDGDDAAAA